MQHAACDPALAACARCWWYSSGCVLWVCAARAQVWSFMALQVVRATPCMRHIPAGTLPNHCEAVDSRLFV